MKKAPRDLVNAIYNEAAQYTGYVTSYGNECAYTDRMIENIIELAVKLAEETNNGHMIKSGSPLKDFLREEVPFRLKEMFEEDFGLTDEEMQDIADEIYDSDTDVIFNYDAIDELIAKEAKRIISTRDVTLTFDEAKQRTVKTNVGEMPLIDYLELEAGKYGYESAEDMIDHGVNVPGYKIIKGDAK